VVLVAGRDLQFVRMLLTCFSTVRSAMCSRAAMPWLVRPSAMSDRTSSSRGLSSSRALAPARGRPTSWPTMTGSSTDPPSPTRRTASASSATGGAEPAVGPRRHPDVDHGHVRSVLLDAGQQGVGVTDLRQHRETGVLEHPGQALAEQHRVVAEN